MAHLYGLCAGDPRSPRAFSGSARQLFTTLERGGHLIGLADVDAPERSYELQGWRRTLRRRRRAGSVLLDRWSRARIAARSARATAALAASGRAFDGVLLYGTDYVPATDAPIGAALDATFAQLARSGEGPFEHLTPDEIATCVAEQRRIFERCTWLFPRTEWCARSLKDDYGVPDGRLVVTGAGPNLDGALPARTHHDGRTLLFVGRDWVRKNGPLVLDAFRLARRERPDLVLEIVGPRGPVHAEPGVLWHGPLDGDDRDLLAELYGRASLFVCPSRFEPYGIAIVEAMAAGCPTITLDRCAAPEIVLDGVTGTCLHDAEPRALAGAILDWLASPERLRRGGAAAATRAAERMTWGRAAEIVARAFDGAGRDPRTNGRARGDGAASKATVREPLG